MGLLLSDRKMKTYLLIGLSVIIAIIVGIVIFSSLGNKRASNYSQLEDMITKAAKSYYKSNSDRLPIEFGDTVEIDDAGLTSAGKLKKMSEIVVKGDSCTAKTIVTNTNGNYDYVTYLDCGSYKTSSISNYITTNSSIVTSGTGLYSVDGDYVYRGENPNNYIKFAGRLYRIVSINEDGTLTIIASQKLKTTLKAVWDDRYNSDRNGNLGINDYAVSRIKDSLLEYVNGTSFNDNDRIKLQSHSLCVGKASENQEVSRNVECSSFVDDQIIGLLTISNFSYASLDPMCKTFTDGACQNYNYLSDYDNSWWTLTGDYDNTYKVYKVNDDAASSKASGTAYIREVLRISAGSSYASGNGTINSPYIIK